VSFDTIFRAETMRVPAPQNVVLEARVIRRVWSASAVSLAADRDGYAQPSRFSPVG